MIKMLVYTKHKTDYRYDEKQIIVYLGTSNAAITLCEETIKCKVINL